MIDIIEILLLDQPPFWLMVCALVILCLSKVKLIHHLWSKLEYKLFGYGSCIQCGKKRQSFWLLTCNYCYTKKFPEERHSNKEVNYETN